MHVTMMHVRCASLCRWGLLSVTQRSARSVGSCAAEHSAADSVSPQRTPAEAAHCALRCATVVEHENGAGSEGAEGESRGWGNG